VFNITNVSKATDMYKNVRYEEKKFYNAGPRNDGAYRDMPADNLLFCLAKINSTTVSISGGKFLNTNKNTYAAGSN
jgi:hypothetical protein